MSCAQDLHAAGCEQSKEVVMCLLKYVGVCAGSGDLNLPNNNATHGFACQRMQDTEIDGGELIRMQRQGETKRVHTSQMLTSPLTEPLNC